MIKNLSLLALSLGIGLINPLSSVVAQVPVRQPIDIDIPVIHNPSPTKLPPLQKVDINTVCSPQNCLGWDEQLWGRDGDKTALLNASC
jgi:membrane-bound lytic murein transglycosylase A